MLPKSVGCVMHTRWLKWYTSPLGLASIQRSSSDCIGDRRHRHGSQRVLWVLHTLLQPQGRRLQTQTALIPSGNQTHRRSTFPAQDPVVTSGKRRVPENTVWRGSSRSHLPRKKRCKVIPAALSLSASLSSPLSQSDSFSESLPDLVREAAYRNPNHARLPWF